jgi:hypothetical protein
MSFDSAVVQLLLNNIPAALVLLIIIAVFLLRDKIFDALKEGINGKTHSKLDAIQTDIQDIKEHDNKQDSQLKGIELDMLKKTVHDERVPKEERLAAAIRYRQRGGNGATKKYIEETLIPENEELWNTLNALIGENNGNL